MIKDFILAYANLIAEFPEKISIEEVNLGENFIEIIIYADKTDTRKLIGRDGRMINAIKTLVIGCKAKNPTSYRITVRALEDKGDK